MEHITTFSGDLLRRGTKNRYWLDLVTDGLGNSLSIPLQIAQGTSDGPRVGLIAIVHGDELNGLPVVQQVFNKIDPEHLRGSVVGVLVANVPGFLQGMREFNDNVDLNKIMPGKGKGNRSEIYAQHFFHQIIGQCTHLLDLHTASKGRVNSHYIRADLTHPVIRMMAYAQNAQILLHHTGMLGTLRRAATDQGIPAITVELGDPQLFQKPIIEKAVEGIFNVLAELGMISISIVPPEREPIICSHSYWIHTHQGGILEVLPLLAGNIVQGEKIALVRNVFGDVEGEYSAPEAGVVIGKSNTPLNQSGSRILHLGIIRDNRIPQE